MIQIDLMNLFFWILIILFVILILIQYTNCLKTNRLPKPYSSNILREGFEDSPCLTTEQKVDSMNNSVNTLNGLNIGPRLDALEAAVNDLNDQFEQMNKVQAAQMVTNDPISLDAEVLPVDEENV